MRYCSTRARMRNAAHPTMMVMWTCAENGLCWEGICSFWIDPNKKLETKKEHKITVSQSSPLGTMTITVDDVVYGCADYASIQCFDITLRDLQWATHWAMQVIYRFDEDVLKMMREARDG